MALYKYEMHAHSYPTSGCSRVSPEDMARVYSDIGYAGICVTEHYYYERFASWSDMSEEAQLNLWLNGYREVKKHGEKLGLNVLLGAELRFPVTGINDYLFYGADEEFFLEHPRLYELGPEKMHELAKQNGFYFGQAHPCRNGCTPVEASWLDGMEVYNGHPTAVNHMDETYRIIKENGLLSTCGSDFHHVEFAGRSAIVLYDKIETSAELAKILHTGDFDGFIIPEDTKSDPDLPFLTDSRFRSKL